MERPRLVIELDLRAAKCSGWKRCPDGHYDPFPDEAELQRADEAMAATQARSRDMAHVQSIGALLGARDAAPPGGLLRLPLRTAEGDEEDLILKAPKTDADREHAARKWAASPMDPSDPDDVAPATIPSPLGPLFAKASARRDPIKYLDRLVKPSEAEKEAEAKAHEQEFAGKKTMSLNEPHYSDDSEDEETKQDHIADKHQLDQLSEIESKDGVEQLVDRIRGSKPSHDRQRRALELRAAGWTLEEIEEAMPGGKSAYLTAREKLRKLGRPPS